MTSKVIEPNEISLNGIYYPISRPVRSTLASIYPAKIVIGDTDKDSDPRSSVVGWSDWRGGIGINRMEGAADVNRAWFSTCQLRYKNHLVLPSLATETTTPSHDLGQATIGAIETFLNVSIAPITPCPKLCEGVVVSVANEGKTKWFLYLS